MSQGLTVDFDAVAFPLTLTLTQDGTGGVTGLAPTVAIRLGSSLTSYLDWDDITFKTSGWGTQFDVMTEVGGGHYNRSLNVAGLVGAGVGDSLVVEYAVDDGGANVAVDSDTIVLQASAERLKEIWQLLGLDTTQPLVVSATDRNTGANVVQTITVLSGTVTVQRVP